MLISKMSDSDYEFWSKRSRASYAEDKAKANGFTKAEAQEIADESFRKLLPDGLNSKNNFLYSARDNDQRVGFIWFSVRGSEGNKRAFICDIIVEEPYRGKGYGKQLMLYMEQEAKKLGLNRIGLHVFDFNETAIRLYQSLGYKTTDLVMEKDI